MSPQAAELPVTKEITEDKGSLELGKPVDAQKGTFSFWFGTDGIVVDYTLFSNRFPTPKSPSENIKKSQLVRHSPITWIGGGVVKSEFLNLWMGVVCIHRNNVFTCWPEISRLVFRGTHCKHLFQFGSGFSQVSFLASLPGVFAPALRTIYQSLTKQRSTILHPKQWSRGLL